MEEHLFRKLLLFISIFVGSSLSGIAMMLWEGQEVKKTRWIGAIFLSGMAGLIVFLLLIDIIGNQYMSAVVGISLLAGVGGASTIDVLSAMLTRVAKKRLGIDDGKKTKDDKETKKKD